MWVGLGGLLLAVAGGGALWYAQVDRLRERGLTFWADVFLATPDGRVRQLTPGDGVYHFATLRPDGSRVVYEGGSSGNVRLWEHDLATGEVVPITPTESAALHPNYSWDGSQIVFISDRATNQEPFRVEQLPIKGMYGPHRFHLFVMDAETRETRQLTDGPYSDFRPSFSPDGETVVFGSTRGGPGYRLYTVPSDGSRGPEAMAFKGLGYNPWYAADGESIFFHTWDGPSDWMCRLKLGEDQAPRLVNDDFERTHGAFADPNGDVLLVHAVRDGRWGMWELPLDGSSARPCQFAGLEHGMHGARIKDGTMTFDVEREIRFLTDVKWRFARLFD